MEISFSAITVPPDAFIDVARVSEQVGYDGLWMSETSHDPFIGLAAATQATDHIALRAAIAVAFARNPMSTAMLANDMQLVSGGRFAIGLGSQLKSHIIRRFGMPWSHPAARMREYVLAMRAIWDCFETGGRLRFRGEFYRHTLMSDYFNPGPNPYGNPQILVAALGELMTEVAGEVADAVVPHLISTRRYLEEVTLPAVRRGREKAGLTMDGFKVYLSPIVATGSTEAEFNAATSKARRDIAFFLATPSYAKALEVHGMSDLREELQRLFAQDRMDDMIAAIDDKILDTFAVVGEPAEVAAKLHERFADLAHGISFYAPHVQDPMHWLPIRDAYRQLERELASGHETPAPTRLPIP